MADVVTNKIGIPVTDLSESKVDGAGVFDLLMKSVNGHLAQQFDLNRIKGAEYATVYLGSIESTLRVALDFLIQRDKAALEAQLLQLQIELGQIEKEKAGVELEKTRVELQILQQQALKIPHEIELLKAQASLTSQQALNAVVEGRVLEAQICKLKAEYDLIMAQIQKAIKEDELLTQKVATEKAQTNGTGVDPNSVIGRQIILYKAQADGFARDAEQKAAKIMADTWNVRRTTDEGTIADGTNKLADPFVGEAITAMLRGVNTP